MTEFLSTNTSTDRNTIKVNVSMCYTIFQKQYGGQEGTRSRGAHPLVIHTVVQHYQVLRTRYHMHLLVILLHFLICGHCCGVVCMTYPVVEFSSEEVCFGIVASVWFLYSL